MASSCEVPAKKLIQLKNKLRDWTIVRFGTNPVKLFSEKSLQWPNIEAQMLEAR
jgi:hypothetical protein